MGFGKKVLKQKLKKPLKNTPNRTIVSSGNYSVGQPTASNSKMNRFYAIEIYWRKSTVSGWSTFLLRKKVQFIFTLIEKDPQNGKLVESL